MILINETAGTGTAGQQAMMIARKAAENGYEPVIYPIVPDTELTSESLVADYDGKADLVLCSGGDGTLHHVMNAVMRLKVRPCLAYLPARLVFGKYASSAGYLDPGTNCGRKIFPLYQDRAQSDTGCGYA